MEEHVEEKPGPVAIINILGLWTAFGVGLGTALGMISGNIVSGTLFGIIFGAGLGMMLSKRRK